MGSNLPNVKHLTAGFARWIHPNGMAAISRWLSEAIPPETRVPRISTPKGSQGRLSVTPSGVVARMQFSPYRIQLAGIKSRVSWYPRLMTPAR